jgi:hypothetical protein
MKLPSVKLPKTLEIILITVVIGWLAPFILFTLNEAAKFINPVLLLINQIREIFPKVDLLLLKITAVVGGIILVDSLLALWEIVLLVLAMRRGARLLASITNATTSNKISDLLIAGFIIALIAGIYCLSFQSSYTGLFLLPAVSF